ncbi:exo-alpha-sialidase [Candidatus Poribacteria bacterium]|jgi:hypothetical protein|nr:exo-alpha-sialidase [Candidatus Poribacteria bacterium]MBT5713723.1 exo-alpha-sialidase [Candidatus Poribacteria bacterium]MBT7805094.1 exo-alpha-sialidase [Candidatus Poribacteria bacterium]
MDGSRLLVGTRKGLFVVDHDGSGWRASAPAFLGDGLSYAAADPRTGAYWACLDHGHWGVKLHRSEDRGASWDELDVPAYPDGAKVADGSDATLTYLWTIAPAGSGEPGRLYAGTEPGGLFVSDDGGASWTLNEPLWNDPTRLTQWFGAGRDHPGVHSVVVDPRDPDHVLVGVSVAGVFETTDGGENWTPRNVGISSEYLPDPTSEVGADPHLLVACPSSPDTLWQQNHCGIYRSVDGAATWHEVSESDGPASFGFAIAVDAQDADTAWVVPAISDEQRVAVDGALCVSRTEDGGATWTAFREGLPQRECFDVTFRHALDVSGDAVAFGTTTGNLYASADRGESWECVGNHLPPINSVRFA